MFFTFVQVKITPHKFVRVVTGKEVLSEGNGPRSRIIFELFFVFIPFVFSSLLKPEASQLSHPDPAQCAEHLRSCKPQES